MVTVRGVVTCPPGYLQTSFTSFYIEAGGCGVNVFMFELLGTALALGDSVEVYGEVAEYISAGTGAGATTQIITSEWAIAVLSTGNPAPEPTELSCAEVNMEENEGRLLSTVGVVTEMQLPWFFYITDGTAEVEVYFGLADSVNPVGIYPGDRVCITGLLGQYDYTPPFLEGYELMPRLTSVCTRRAWVSRRLQGGLRFASPAHPAPPFTLAGDTRSVRGPAASHSLGSRYR
jgi:hypothetical protein